MTEKNTKPLGIGFWIKWYVIDLSIGMFVTYLVIGQSYVLPTFLVLTIFELFSFIRYTQSLPYQKKSGKEGKTIA